MNVPVIPGHGEITIRGERVSEHIEMLIEEINDMAGKHGTYSTGDGKKSGRKPKTHEITQKSSGGATLWKLTAKLWPMGKDKGKSK